MLFKITCPFSLSSSHEINVIGFRGENNVKLAIPFHQDDFLGNMGTRLEIYQSPDERYNLEVVSISLDTKDKQVNYLEMVADYLSFLINRTESNPRYGNIFVQIEWLYLKAYSVQCDTSMSNFIITDRYTTSSTRTVVLDDEQVTGGTYHDILRFYFNGLRAEHKKSKYFHWFLILEYLENSIKYKVLFDSNRLFNEREARQLRAVASKMSDGVKKSAVLNLLSRTKEFRNFKLLTIIKSLGINHISNQVEKIEISEGLVKDITEGRNALFHSGSDFPDIVLWDILFPLVTQIVEHVSCNQGCLDA